MGELCGIELILVFVYFSQYICMSCGIVYRYEDCSNMNANNFLHIYAATK